MRSRREVGGEGRGGPGYPPRPALPVPAGRQRNANIWINIWSTNGARELKEARDAVGPPLSFRPASPRVRPARGAGPSLGTPRYSPPPMGPGLAREGSRGATLLASLEGGFDPRQNTRPTKRLLLPLLLNP